MIMKLCSVYFMIAMLVKDSFGTPSDAEKQEIERAIQLRILSINQGQELMKNYIGRGTDNVKLGKIDDAKRDFTSAAQHPSSDPYDFFRLGEALRSLGEYKEAKKHYATVNVMAPDDFDLTTQAKAGLEEIAAAGYK